MNKKIYEYAIKFILLIVLLITEVNLFSVEIKAKVYNQLTYGDINNESYLTEYLAVMPGNLEYYIQGNLIIKSGLFESTKGYMDIISIFYPVEFTQSEKNSSIYINEIYFSCLMQYYSFSIGKQYIKWGSSQFFNPIDIINLKSGLNDMDKNEGVPSFEITIPFRDLLSLTAITFIQEPKGNIENLPLIIKTSFFVNYLDIFLFGYFQKNHKPVLGINIDLSFPINNFLAMKLYGNFAYKQETYYYLLPPL